MCLLKKKISMESVPTLLQLCHSFGISTQGMIFYRVGERVSFSTEKQLSISRRGNPQPGIAIPFSDMQRSSFPNSKPKIARNNYPKGVVFGLYEKH